MTKIGERKREKAHVAYYRVMNEIVVAHSYIVMHAAEERKGEKEMTKVYTRRRHTWLTHRVMNEIVVAHSYIVMNAVERKGEKEMTKVYTRREKKGGDTLGSLTESWR